MKKINRILWGVAFVAVGVIIALNALEIVDVTLFFDGWWTLFIIVPSAIGLLSGKDITGSLIGLGIGVALLLGCLDVIKFEMLWKLLVPFIIIVIGLKLIFGSFFSSKINRIKEKAEEKHGKTQEYCSTFSGQNLNFAGEEFKGAELTAVFGGIKCDLRNAILNEDVVIKVCSIFGGVDILLPYNVNLKVSSNSIFGGVSDKHDNSGENTVTVYVDANCIFGGADVK